MELHRALRPTWACERCGDAWPCASSRAELRRAYGADTVGIVLLMSGYLLDAVQDLEREPAAEVTARFVGWCQAPRASRRLRRGSYLASRSRAI